MPLRILLLVPLPGITATDPCVLHGEANRDPHLHFAHGGRADFRGEDGRFYSFLSAPGLAVNVKTENAVFRMNNGRVEVCFCKRILLGSRAYKPRRGHLGLAGDYRSLREAIFQVWEAGLQDLLRTGHSNAVL